MFFLLVFVSHFHSVINSEQEQNSTSLQTENLLTPCLFQDSQDRVVGVVQTLGPTGGKSRSQQVYKDQQLAKLDQRLARRDLLHVGQAGHHGGGVRRVQGRRQLLLRARILQRG